MIIKYLLKLNKTVLCQIVLVDNKFDKCNFVINVKIKTDKNVKVKS